MNSPETPVYATPAPAFAPLPLRARGPVEILDVAVRVYKQYFWTLLAWSALVAVCSVLLSLLPLMSLFSLCLAPLVTGACVCCIAAAVRGQQLTFKQCGDFSKGRYGPMLGMYIISGLVAFGIIVLMAIVAGLVIAVLGSFGNSSTGLVVGIVFGTAGGLAFVFICSCLVIWAYFVQIVVCMEEDKRGSLALRRAYDLLQGHWIRVSVLTTLLGAGALVLALIFAAAIAMIIGIGSLGQMMNGLRLGPGAWTLIMVWSISVMLISAVWQPLLYLTLSLFYLDLRIRKEALDLEWTAHTTTPQHVFDAAPAANVWATDGPGTGGFVGVQPEAPTGANSWYDAVPATPAAPVPNLHNAAAAPIAPRVICSHCGASVPAAETCSNCGARLPVAPTSLLDVRSQNVTSPDEWTRSASTPTTPTSDPSGQAPQPPYDSSTPQP